MTLNQDKNANGTWDYKGLNCMILFPLVLCIMLYILLTC